MFSFRKIVFVLFLLYAHLSSISAKETISSQEAALLSPFFTLLLEKCEAGYVFYDKKPVCLQQLFSLEEQPLNEPHFNQFTISFWGAQKALESPLFQSKNICLRVHPDEGYLLIINRKLFLKTVQENLPLFQYVLGPAVTSEALLQAALSKDKEFLSVFNYDKVLIGIVLGYGVQNSLFGARMENIMDMMLSKDVPPFNSKVHLCNSEWKKMLLLSFHKNHVEDEKVLKMGFGFASLKEELEVLEKKVELPSERLDNENPPFVFGCLKDREETIKFIAELEQTQQRIQKLLQSANFLQDVVEIIAEEKVVVERAQEPHFQPSKANPNIAAAKLIRSQLEKAESPLFSIFLKGFLEKGDGNYLEADRMAFFSDFGRNLLLARQKVEEADQFFANLKKDQEFTAILDPYLYYKTVKEGQGRALKEERQVCVDFEIYDPSGNCLHCDSKATLDLQETIPGFAYGIRGMKTGEKRTLLIHPSLAYGVHTYLEKGIYLKALVRLIEVYDSAGEPKPLVPIDLDFVRSDTFQMERVEQRKNALCCQGVDAAQFLRSFQRFDIEAVGEALRTTDEDESLTAEESDALHQIFWNYYFGFKPI